MVSTVCRSRDTHSQGGVGWGAAWRGGVVCCVGVGVEWGRVGLGGLVGWGVAWHGVVSWGVVEWSGVGVGWGWGWGWGGWGAGGTGVVRGGVKKEDRAIHCSARQPCGAGHWASGPLSAQGRPHHLCFVRSPRFLCAPQCAGSEDVSGQRGVGSASANIWQMSMTGPTVQCSGEGGPLSLSPRRPPPAPPGLALFFI